MTSQTGSPSPNFPPAAKPSLLLRAFGSAMFSGYSPLASGTAGSAVAIILYWWWGLSNPYVLGLFTALVFLAGIKAASVMESFYGHDPAEVTIDEVAGQWIALLFLPSTVPAVIGSFFVFRFMDIVKPFPARNFDRQHGGFAIMMDDVVAGIYANLVMQIVLRLPVIGGLFS